MLPGHTACTWLQQLNIITMNKYLLLPVCFAVYITTVTAQKFTPIFNGKDLTGWHVLSGNAGYTVKDGMIEGTTAANATTSFLVTDKSYGDFVLQLEVKTDATVNSGIQVRSESKDDYLNGKVYGYQVEVDPSDRAWTGGIHDVNQKGWLYPLTYNPPAQKAYKQGDWNKLYIECIGNHIRTWLNGVPAADLVDDGAAAGFIGLQVHDLNNTPGGHVYFKNIQLQATGVKAKPITNIYVVNNIPNTVSEQEKKNGVQLLFDGKTNTGWRGIYKQTFPDKGWEIKDGILTIHSSNGQEEGLGGDIVTEKEYSAFELDFDFKLTPAANSGVKYFVKETYDSKGKSGIGLEYQVLDDSLHPDAKLGLNGDRTLSSLYDLIARKNIPAALKKIGEWNHGRILVYANNHVEHWLNGYKVLEYEKGSKDFLDAVAISKYKVWPNFGLWPNGHILLQDHGNEVSYRSIKIKVL